MRYRGNKNKNLFFPTTFYFFKKTNNCPICMISYKLMTNKSNNALFFVALLIREKIQLAVKKTSNKIFLPSGNPKLHSNLLFTMSLIPANNPTFYGRETFITPTYQMLQFVLLEMSHKPLSGQMRTIKTV